MNSLLRSTVVVVALVASAGAAHAQGSAFTTNQRNYFGVSLGSASDFGTAVKLYAGVPVYQGIFGEFQYANWGSTKVSGVSVSADTIGASAVGFFDVNREVRAFGKLGVHVSHAKGGGASTSDTNLGLGLGALYNLSPTTQIRGEFENIGGSGGNLWTVGVQFAF